MQLIGSADEFWRLRLTRVDTTAELEFEWHDDILYREPRVQVEADVELWHVEAVQLENHDEVVRIATFSEREDAEAFFDRAVADLGELTKSQFEDAYLYPDRFREDL